MVLGGFHPTFLPEEASLHADSVVIGEAEDIWPQLIEDFKNGRLKRIYQSKERSNLIGLPIPRTDLLKKEKYFFPNQISIARGCPFSCKFCSVTRYFGGTYRFRPMEEVIAEVELFKNKNEKWGGFLEISKCIHFIDDNIVARPSYSKELFKALIPYKIKWVGAASLTIAEDEELIQLAARSGCIGLFMGFESINQVTLNLVKKKANFVEKYEKAIKKIHSYEIGIQGSFIFGFDGDDESVFEKTVHFAQNAKLELAEFNILTPYPGTKIYEELDSEGRILIKDWSKYDNSHAVFKPKLMTSDVLEKGTYWAWEEFYKTSSIFHRIGLTHRHLLSAWVINLFTRTYYRKYFALRRGKKFQWS